MSNATDGPWILTLDTTLGSMPVHRVNGIGQDVAPVCYIYVGLSPETKARAIANATLITTAPELANMLTRLYGVTTLLMFELQTMNYTSEQSDLLKEIMDKAEATIKKII